MSRKRMKAQRQKALGRPDKPADKLAAPQAPGGERASKEISKETGTKIEGGARPDRSTFDSVRENAEAFLVAVILALIIRHFALEAFEIPTGSMANTLFGIHAWLKCPNCSTDFNAALQSDPSSGQLIVPYQKVVVYDGRCPNPNCTLDIHSKFNKDKIICGACGTEFQGNPANYRETEADVHKARCPICHLVYDAVIERSNKTGGHKILVDKFAYVVGKPRRWDVIVFEFDQWKNYIKRLVGLPGEKINVWDGDVYIDGKIERKSRYPSIQDVLWTKISDSNVAERGLNRIPAWAELAPAGAGRQIAESKYAQWNEPMKRWSLNAPGDLAVLEYQRGFENYYNYNVITRDGVRGSPSNVQVGDKKVAFTTKVVGAGRALPPETGTAKEKESWVGAEIRDGNFTFQLRVPVGSPPGAPPAILERMTTESGPSPSPLRPPDASKLRAEAAVSIPVGSAARIEFENADDRVAAKVNGKEVLSLEYTSFPEGSRLEDRPTPPSEMAGAHYIRLIVSNAQVELESIQVYRDMYYIDWTNYGHWPGIQLREGEYFAMGDNAPSSADGRYWGSIPEKNLMGKAFVVFWPAWPTNFQCKFIK